MNTSDDAAIGTLAESAKLLLPAQSADLRMLAQISKQPQKWEPHLLSVLLWLGSVLGVLGLKYDTNMSEAFETASVLETLQLSNLRRTHASRDDAIMKQTAKRSTRWAHPTLLCV